ncbi:MAG TPA: protein rhiA [Thermoanaerobaculia bacterium]|nr:protein rhiA [Thermoanaerobaculia bacterium]
MSQLQLILVNNSPNPGNIVVYQQLGSQPSSNPLAWFSKYVYPNTQVSFSWNPTDYDFVWAGTGKITSGVVFDASQVVPAALGSTNQITLSYDSLNHVFFFNNQKAGPQANQFTIVEDGTLPANAAAVGIGMAGRATFAVQAMPNMTVQISPAGATYWVTFGTVQQGEFFTVETLLTPVQVEFPLNVNSMTVTLNADNTWTVTPNILMARA